jgi:hypothetical protein
VLTRVGDDSALDGRRHTGDDGLCRGVIAVDPQQCRRLAGRTPDEEFTPCRGSLGEPTLNRMAVRLGMRDAKLDAFHPAGERRATPKEPGRVAKPFGLPPSCDVLNLSVILNRSSETLSAREHREVLSITVDGLQNLNDFETRSNGYYPSTYTAFIDQSSHQPLLTAPYARFRYAEGGNPSSETTFRA